MLTLSVFRVVLKGVEVIQKMTASSLLEFHFRTLFGGFMFTASVVALLDMVAELREPKLNVLLQDVLVTAHYPFP